MSKPIKTAKKICFYALTESCERPDCTFPHPKNPQAARNAYNALLSKTLTLCVNYPQCKRLGCTYLHADTEPARA